jgi:hypothetical protein
MIDYATPNPTLLDKVKLMSDDALTRLLENAKAKLPETQWLVDAIVAEQVGRGGLRNMNANSVREVILKYARRGETCTYKTIADELSIKWSQAHRPMPKILGQVSEMEHGSGRPLLTAIVVAQSGKCGDGFFEMAGRTGARIIDNQRFQEEEQRRVFDYWSER